ncbi:hypothetical protein IWX46DRAFT_43719 [Phyllosticta citricarpa]|uniref:Uncharacterized protein n=1 Tax=Phyllosticta citricarpa TaxID=55181 RepID=A0ABR1MFF2_9PEZI
MVVVSAESDGKGPASMHPDSAAAVGHDALIEHTPADDNVPLLPHESISPDAPQQAPLFPHEAAVAVSSGSSNCTEDDEDDAAGPETFQPVDFKGDIPLFRHESIALPPGEGGSGSEHKPPPSLQNMMDQEDPNDPSLVPFPTKRETIYEHIRSLEHRLEEDQSIPEESTSNSPSSQAVAEEPAPPSPLDSIQEDHEEEEDPANVASLNVQRDGQAERHHHARTVGSVPTPPLTPTSESASKKHERADSVFAIPADNIGARIEASQTVYEDSRSKPISGDDDQQHKVVASSPKGAPSDKRRQGALIAIWNTLFGSWLGPIGRWFSSLCGGRGRATRHFCHLCRRSCIHVPRQSARRGARLPAGVGIGTPPGSTSVNSERQSALARPARKQSKQASRQARMPPRHAFVDPLFLVGQRHDAQSLLRLT